MLIWVALLSCGRRGAPLPVFETQAITQGTLHHTEEGLQLRLDCPDTLPPVTQADVTIWHDDTAIAVLHGSSCIVSGSASIHAGAWVRVTGAAVISPARGAPTILPIRLHTAIPSTSVSPAPVPALTTPH